MIVLFLFSTVKGVFNYDSHFLNGQKLFSLRIARWQSTKRPTIGFSIITRRPNMKKKLSRLILISSRTHIQVKISFQSIIDSIAICFEYNLNYSYQQENMDPTPINTPRKARWILPKMVRLASIIFQSSLNQVNVTNQLLVL
jgi:hypothetical protein